MKNQEAAGHYSNAPSSASGQEQVDVVASIVQDSSGDFFFADGGSGLLRSLRIRYTP